MPQAPLTRQVQRDALHSTIWKVANKLRGNVDGWDFKMYVLGMLFYRFISENLAAYINAKQGISSTGGRGGGEPQQLRKFKR